MHNCFGGKHIGMITDFKALNNLINNFLLWNNTPADKAGERHWLKYDKDRKWCGSIRAYNLDAIVAAAEVLDEN